MDKSQKLALVFISIGIFIGVLVLVVSGGGLQTIGQSTFRAAPGKQLDAARPMYSDTAQEAPVQSNGAPEPLVPPEGFKNAHPRESDQTSRSSPSADAPQSAADKVILEARNALDPRTGIDRIQELLWTLENLAEISRLYTAKADLYLRCDPPDLEGAAAAASEAVRCAEEPDVRDEAGFVQADVLRQSGDIEAAQEVAARIVSGEGPLTAGKLRAGLLQAEMKRAAGDTEAAAAAYRDVMRRIAATQEPLDGQSTDLYRQAALNLVQMLRQSGNREEADAVAEEASRQLSRLRERTGS